MVLLRNIFYKRILPICMIKSNQSLEMTSINAMKQGFNFYTLSKILFSGLLFFSITFTSLYAQDGDAAKGKSLFNANCLNIFLHLLELDCQEILGLLIKHLSYNYCFFV